MPKTAVAVLTVCAVIAACVMTFWVGLALGERDAFDRAGEYTKQQNAVFAAERERLDQRYEELIEREKNYIELMAQLAGDNSLMRP